MNVRVNMKVLGKRRNVVEAVPFAYDPVPQTVEQLIRDTVAICVDGFQKRVDNANLLTALSPEQIQDQADNGKIAFGAYANTHVPVLKEAQDGAVLAFSDGIFRIFLDDRELLSLTDLVHLTERSVLTFIRLTLLAGRLW